MAKHSDKVDVKRSQDVQPEAGLPAFFERGYPFFRLRDDVDRVFDRFFGTWPALRSFESAFGDDGGRMQTMPRVDVSETEAAYEITAEMPGLTDEDVEVTLQDDLLTISGEKKTEREEKKKDYHLTERSYGSFQRSFRLPAEVEAEKIEAEMQDGVMSITLPKSPASQAKLRKVKISKRDK